MLPNIPDVSTTSTTAYGSGSHAVPPYASNAGAGRENYDNDQLLVAAKTRAGDIVRREEVRLSLGLAKPGVRSEID